MPPDAWSACLCELRKLAGQTEWARCTCTRTRARACAVRGGGSGGGRSGIGGGGSIGGGIVGGGGDGGGGGRRRRHRLQQLLLLLLVLLLLPPGLLHMRSLFTVGLAGHLALARIRHREPNFCGQHDQERESMGHDRSARALQVLMPLAANAPEFIAHAGARKGAASAEMLRAFHHALRTRSPGRQQAVRAARQCWQVVARRPEAALAGRPCADNRVDDDASAGLIRWPGVALQPDLTPVKVHPLQGADDKLDSEPGPRTF